jgi:xanthine dehydrogenase iron-sulfur cluster and FAD-binding subunit A
VSAAFLIERDPATSKVVRSNVAYGGVAATPVRLPIVEESLTGRKLDEVDPLEFEPLFLQSIKPLSDVRGSADYRRVLALNLFCKMLETLRSGSERSIKTQPDRLRHRTLPTGRTHA